MNDRYLFRAKRIDNGEWVCGGSIIRFEDHGIESFYMPDYHEKCICTHDEHDNITGFEDCTFYKVDPATICQCTGLRDENGKLIWENDIVSCSGNLKVSWNKKYSGYCLKKEGWAYQHFFGEACEPCDCEVIGNIFDNPILFYGGINVLTQTERENIKSRFSEYCRDKGIDETSDTMFNWLGMMDLLNEEAIKELPEIKK